MSIIETIKIRRSCRTYRDSPVEPDKLADLKAFLKQTRRRPSGAPSASSFWTLTNWRRMSSGPSAPMASSRGKAVHHRCGRKGPKAMEDYGYSMEKNILKATALVSALLAGRHIPEKRFRRSDEPERRRTSAGYQPRGVPRRSAITHRSLFPVQRRIGPAKRVERTVLRPAIRRRRCPGNPPAGTKRRSSASGEAHRLRTNSPGGSSGTGAAFTSPSPGRPATTG